MYRNILLTIVGFATIVAALGVVAFFTVQVPVLMMHGFLSVVAALGALTLLAWLTYLLGRLFFNILNKEKSNAP